MFWTQCIRLQNGGIRDYICIN